MLIVSDPPGPAVCAQIPLPRVAVGDPSELRGARTADSRSLQAGVHVGGWQSWEGGEKSFRAMEHFISSHLF